MDEEIKQIQLEMLEELRALREQSGTSSMARPTEGLKVGETNKALGNFNRAVDEADDELAELGISSRGLNRAQIDQIKSAYEYKKALDTQVEALKKSADAFKDLGKTLINQERGFEKYGKGLESLGDAVGQATSSFGPLGKAVGSLIQGLTKLGSVYMEQTDKLLKANDSIAQFGTAGSFTTKQLMEMAHGAGITSKNMDLLVKPIQSLGPNLMMLGKNTGDSVKAFADLTKISNQQREEFQRLGISQEQLLQTQADYVALQAMSGRNIKNEMKDRAALQQASLNYQDTLLELATLTGQDVESVKKKQQEATRAVEWQISQIQLENRARKLEAEGRQADADKLRKEAKTKQEALDRIAALGNETLTKGARQYLATGTISGEDAQALTRMGLMKDLEELRRATKNGADAQQASAKFQDAYNKKFGQTVDNVGFAAQHSRDVARQFGMDVQSLENYNKQRDTNFQDESKAAKDRIEAAKKSGKDPAQDARAKLTTVEIEAGKAMDKLVGSINPLLSGFTALTVGGTLAAAALMGLAATAGSKLLGSMSKAGADAVKNAMGAIRGAGAVGAAAPVASTVATAAAPAAATAATAAAPAAATAATAGATGAAGAASTAASALSRLAGPLAGLSKAAPMIGTVMSVGSGVIDAYQGIKKADKDLQEGKITKQEARVEKAEATGGGVGTAVGGTAGALKGAAAGAAIGSVVPVLGTAVGGIIGAALGGWLGSKAGKAIGEVAGGGIAKMTADADKEVDNAKKKSDSKEKNKVEDKEKSQRATPDVAKVQIVNTNPILVTLSKSIDTLAKLSPDSKSPFVQTSAKTESREMNLEELEAWKKKLVDKGPASNSAMSQQMHKSMLQTLDKAIDKAKTTQTAPGTTAKDTGTSAISPELAKQFDINADALEKLAGKEDKVTGKAIPVIIEKIDDPNLLKALGTVGGKSEAVKPAFGTGTMAGMALGTMLAGPLGMMVGGLIGSKFNKAQPNQTPSSPTIPATSTTPQQGTTPSIPQPAPKAASPVVAKAESKGDDKEQEYIKKIQYLEQERKKLIEKGPASESTMSKHAHEKVLSTLERATDAERQKLDDYRKKQQSAPQAAIGGVFEGPKSGYPVQLHGKEIVVPMGTGNKSANLPDDDDDGPMPKLDSYGEDLDKLGKTFKESENILKKFTTTLTKLNDFEEEELKEKEDDANELTKVQDKLKNAFSGAFIDLTKFSKNLKIKTETGESAGEAGTPVQTGFGGILRSSSGEPVTSGRPASVQATKPTGEIKPMTEPPKLGSMGEKADTKEMQGALLKELGSMGISDTKSQANILAQVQAESGFKPRSEELEKYSAKTLFKMYGTGNQGGNKVRFGSIEEAQALVDKGPEAVGDIIYGGRMGNTEPGEGYKYRGRGLIQLTGKSNYEKYGKLIGVDLVKDPDLANDPAVATKLAAVYFKEKQAKGVDLSNISAVGKSVGYAGGARETEKRAQYAKAFEGQLGTGALGGEAGGTQYASAQQTKIPQAQRGGIFSGPESGYIVELHGNEIVIPTEKIADVAKQELQSVMPTETSSADIFSDFTSKVQEVVSNQPDMSEALRGLQDELKNSFTQLTQQRNEPTGTPLGTGEENLTSVMIDKLDQLIQLMSESNSTQGKLLQNARV